MNFESFNHGQIQSKIWLCEKLEFLLPEHPSVLILGSWHNILGFIMLARQPKRYAFITGIDIDPEAKPIADKICEAWTMSDTVKLKNLTEDANETKFMHYNVVINCSVEHMENNGWFDKIEKNALVCIQSSDLPENFDPVWKITNPNLTLDILKEKYPLSQTLYSGEKQIQYENWGYKRFMIIGIK